MSWPLTSGLPRGANAPPEKQAEGPTGSWNVPLPGGPMRVSCTSDGLRNTAVMRVTALLNAVAGWPALFK